MTTKQVPSLPEWSASECGAVFWRGSLSPRKPRVTKLGYFEVDAYYGPGKTNHKRFKVHRLVAAAWIPNPMNHHEVNHIDGTKANNHASNLEWCSRADNIRHSYKLGLKKYRAGLSADQAQSIFRRAHAGERTSSLAQEFGIPQSKVSDIKKGRIYASMIKNFASQPTF